MSKGHTKVFIGLTATVAMAVTGTFGSITNASAAASPEYRVVGVESGDTIIVRIGNRNTRVRMIGIDSPETSSRATSKKGCYAQQALTNMRNKTRSQTVRLYTDPKLPDKWSDGSLLRYVYMGGEDLGATAIYNGAAREYMYQHKNYSARSWYKSLEKSAYNRKRGLYNLSICPMNTTM